MKTLRNGKWNTSIATKEEVAETVREIKEVVQKYGWQDRVVHIYYFGDKIGELIERWDDFANDFASYSFGSKKILISEINGLISILEKWVKVAEEPKVTININGEIKDVAQSVAEDLIDLGIAYIA